MRNSLWIFLLMGTALPARAWEAKAADVERRWTALEEARASGKDERAEAVGKKAKSPKKPSWAATTKGAEQPSWLRGSYWTEEHQGKTYYFAVGVASKIRNPALRLTAAEDRARSELMHPLGKCESKSSEGFSAVKCRAVLKGARILDWFQAGDDLFALAVAVY